MSHILSNMFHETKNRPYKTIIMHIENASHNPRDVTGAQKQLINYLTKLINFCRQDSDKPPSQHRSSP